MPRSYRSVRPSHNLRICGLEGYSHPSSLDTYRGDEQKNCHIHPPIYLPTGMTVFLLTTSPTSIFPTRNKLYAVYPYATQHLLFAVSRHTAATYGKP